jgi:hypothetical protein
VIFLSFRHGDTHGTIRALWNELRERFHPSNIYYYIERSGKAGDDVYKEVEAEIDKADIVLGLFGKNWLEAVDAFGRRIENPLDLVRFELELALEQDKLIPVRVEGAGLPDERFLPHKLKPLSALKLTLPLRDEGWRSDIAKIISTIERELGLEPHVDANVFDPVYPDAPWRGRRVRINAGRTRLPFSPRETLQIHFHATTPIASGPRALSPRATNVVQVLLSNQHLGVIHLGSPLAPEEIQAFQAGKRDSEVWVLPYTTIRGVSLERRGSDAPRLDITYEWKSMKTAKLSLSGITPKDAAPRAENLLKALAPVREPAWKRLL